MDEIVLSYVASILEELGSESSQEADLFDVESFSEMLTAYFPEFASIPHGAICDWIFELSAQLSKCKQGTINNNIIILFLFSIFLHDNLDAKGLKMTLESLTFHAPVATKPETLRLSPRVSESSDLSNSDSSHSSFQV